LDWYSKVTNILRKRKNVKRDKYYETEGVLYNNEHILLLN